MLISAKNEMDEVFRPYLLCSENIRKDEFNYLEKYFEVVLLPSFSDLPNTVSSHADTLICPIGDSLAVFEKYYRENREIFDKNNIKTVKIDESAGKKYPEDILLNGLFLSGILYGRTDKLSKTLTAFAKNSVYIRQGYARCSVCKLSDRAIITADKSIANAARAGGIDVLEISEGNIVLDGCDYGFIGGASFVYKDNIFFFGKVENHPDFEKIRDFAEKYSLNIISLSQAPLCDIGGAVIYEDS